MAITTSDFDSLTKKVDEIFVETAGSKVAENVGFELFDISDTSVKSYDYQAIHGMGNIEKIAEGEDLPNVTGKEGDSATWTQSRYGGIAPVTKDMRKFDRHNKIEKVIKTTTETAFDMVDQSLADVLSHGWSTSYTDVYGESVSAVTPDAKSLFNTSHSSSAGSTTFSNVINDGTNNNPKFSRQAIVSTRSRDLTYQDPSGVIRPVKYDTIIVPPSLEDRAMRIVNTEQMPGSANNDVNPVSGWIDRIITWERLEQAADGTDTSSYWYLADLDMLSEPLRALFAERPEMDAPEQVYKNKNWEYSLDFYYAIGRGYPKGIAGSDASES